MAGAAKIAQLSESLSAVERESGTAASVLSSASSCLDSAIPSDAFGAAGTAIAAAGNQFGAALGALLESMSKTATQLSQGASSARAEFERVEDDAAARFRSVEIGD